jgi:hypothetical protein
MLSRRKLYRAFAWRDVRCGDGERQDLQEDEETVGCVHNCLDAVGPTEQRVSRCERRVALLKSLRETDVAQWSASRVKDDNNRS